MAPGNLENPQWWEGRKNSTQLYEILLGEGQDMGDTQEIAPCHGPSCPSAVSTSQMGFPELGPAPSAKLS